MSQAFGIDISRWQGALDWARLQADGVQFAFAKATEGTTIYDAYFQRNWTAMKAAGVVRGAYHFFRPAQGLLQQALNFVRTVPLEAGDMPLALDLEDAGGLSPYGLTQAIKVCLDEIERLSGRRPIIYTGPNFWNTSVAVPSAPAWTQDYALWIANYTSAPAPIIPKGWSGYTLWQYSSSGKFVGSAATFDLDRYNGTLEQLKAWTGVEVLSHPPRIVMGPHSLVDTGDSWEWFRVLQPSVIKFYTHLENAAPVPPGILVVGRPEENFIGEHAMLSGDPEALGRQMGDLYAPWIGMYPRVDIWEGPNEVTPGDWAEMDWYARFLAAFAKRIKELGKRAGIGSFATGNPRPELWPAYVPALRACRDFGAIHMRHCYGKLDRWSGLRFQDDQAAFNQLGFNPWVILSECGAEYEKGPDGEYTFRPWREQYGNDIERYINEYLVPLILAVNACPYVLGICVFTVGDGGNPTTWHKFDLSGEDVPARLERRVKEMAMPDYWSKTIQGDSFLVEKVRVAPGEKIWFRFQVTNRGTVDVNFSILGAVSETGGWHATSWTNQRLKPNDPLEWRDNLVIDEPGSYQVYLGICYGGQSGCEAMQQPWDRLSASVTVIVGDDAPEEVIMTELVTADSDNIAVAAMVTSGSNMFQAVRDRIQRVLRDLVFKLSGGQPKIVLALPEAGYRVMLFDKPGGTPKFWVPTWDMDVHETVTDAEGVVWHRVNPPEREPMWLLAAHITVKV